MFEYSSYRSTVSSDLVCWNLSEKFCNHNHVQWQCTGTGSRTSDMVRVIDGRNRVSFLIVSSICRYCSFDHTLILNFSLSLYCVSKHSRYKCIMMMFVTKM